MEETDVEKGYLVGYGTVFNQWIDISDWDGEYRESFQKGAFRKTLKERTPIVQFEHGYHPMIGSIPICEPPELREEDAGLFFRAKMHEGPFFDPVREAVRSGAISGMSIRFVPMKDKRQRIDGIEHRTHTEVSLLEVGPVVWPAYEGTSIGLRSLLPMVSSLTPAERARLIVALTGDVNDDSAAEQDSTEEPTRFDRVTRAEIRRAIAMTRGIRA
jgi:HK97 family phage prohead protease